jgi:hypothetical protein
VLSNQTFRDLYRNATLDPEPAFRKFWLGLYRRHSAIASLTATSKSSILLALNG